MYELKKKKKSSEKKWTIGKITLKSKVLNSKKIKETPKAIPISPIRFIIIAFKADLLASSILNQKLIKR